MRNSQSSIQPHFSTRSIESDVLAYRGTRTMEVRLKLPGAPVVLVVDASMMARLVGPMVFGYTLFDTQLRLGGVIVNRVGGVNHKKWIGDALTSDERLVDCGSGEHIVFAGALPMDKAVAVPERHLGLHMPSDASSPDSVSDRFLKLAALMEKKCRSRCTPWPLPGHHRALRTVSHLPQPRAPSCHRVRQTCGVQRLGIRLHDRARTVW